MRPHSASPLITAALLSGALPLAAAHGDAPMNMSQIDGADAPEHQLASYWQHPEHFGWNLAHMILMLLAWVLFMPLAIFLSVARSRFHLPAQVLFHIVNGLGVFTAFVYNHSTPDLYANNSHHPLAWVVTAFTIAWTLVSFYVAYGEYRSSRKWSLERGKLLNAQNMALFHCFQDEMSPRDSRDSGQGTERNSASLFGSRQNSSDHVYQKLENDDTEDVDLEDEHDEQDQQRQSFLGNNRIGRFISKSVQKCSTHRASKAVRGGQIILEKILLLLGFAALTSGFVVCGGLFRDRMVFSGLAHYVKGGIFIWYGFLTLGRWMGAFTEFGWAWNVRPQGHLLSKWKSRIPSAEFTESFVIWLYGATNVFLEHLNNRGGAWMPSDIEHLSITALFFGGGLLGMIVDVVSRSEWVLSLMNTTVDDQKSKDDNTRFAVEAPEDQLWAQPNTYRVPLNPMPAMTMMLLGMMMGAHHQTSMVSTMMHAQWGGLFKAFALARGVTYITLYLKPPTSHFPSRPPSEIVAAFCLTSGGLLFMNSASDVVWAIESNGLDAMTIFTCTMGITGIVLGWEVVLFAVKGWALRKERGREMS